MVIVPVFATNIFMTELKPEDYELVQEELQRVYDDNTQNKLFNDPWNNGRMRLSHNAFEGDIIKKYDLKNFKRVLTDAVAFLNEDGKVRAFNVVNSWMTSLKKGMYAHNHQHIAPYGSHISGVYYFKTAEDDSPIVFENPNLSNVCFSPALGSEETLSCKPIQGHLLMFPSWLRHYIETQLDDRERVSVSFTLGLENPYLDKW